MLFKSVIMAHSRSLKGDITPARDPIAYLVPETFWREFRERALDDISGAVAYRLDAEAADYADSLREGLQNYTFTEEMSQAVVRVMEEVPLPHDLIWVEHDHAALARGRLKRGHESDEEGFSPDEFGPRGQLIDNRSPDVLKTMVFRTAGSGSSMIIDPIFELHFTKAVEEGRPRLSSYKAVLHDHMLEFYSRQGISQQDFHNIENQELNDASYDMAIPFMVFASMNTKDDDLNFVARDSLSTSEKKSARKFGKSWITDRLRTHVTISIGPSARAHLKEQSERKAHERAVAAGRAAPVEHWVAEHERHYKSGKVVLIRAHRRGTKVDDSVPRFVRGPRGLDG